MSAAVQPPHVFVERRNRLREQIGNGLLVIQGHPKVWRNADNPHPFRQGGHFLYLADIRRPSLVLVLNADTGEDILFGSPEDPDDLIWHGPHPLLADEATEAGITDIRDKSTLVEYLYGKDLHFPPLFIPDHKIEMSEWLGVDVGEVNGRASTALTKAIGELRLIKNEAEIVEIEEAIAGTKRMFLAGFVAARPGVTENEVRAAMTASAYAEGKEFSFNPIISVRGEVLHNETYLNTLQDGDLLLIDAGLETPAGYAADITRTIPVSGHFTDRQRQIYQIVLDANVGAIEFVRPGVTNRQVHDEAARIIAEGLINLGLMKGNPAVAVKAGAHTLFFVHGIGHPIGLDTHDLQDLGDTVAYSEDAPRSKDFGTAFLRFGRELQPGMVLTIEPGIYFIPALIDRWKSEGRHAEFINYDILDEYLDFGGIRIEDDVLCTDTGYVVLGPPIPKTVAELEAILIP